MLTINLTFVVLLSQFWWALRDCQILALAKKKCLLDSSIGSELSNKRKKNKKLKVEKII